MNILITGIEGFVGPYLLRELREHVPTDTEITGLGYKELPADHFEGVSHYTRLDISDGDAFRDYLIKQEPDVIYHLAAISSVAESFQRPVDTFRINQMGSLCLLETAVKDLGCRPRILLVGSADVYRSRPDDKPMNEETQFRPLSPYAASKAAVDYLGVIYWRNYGLEVLRTRSFNHFGPGQEPVFVMSSFARQVAAIELGLQEPVVNVGNLNVKRDFTDVRDVVRAYRLIMEKGSPGDVYNVSSFNAVSIDEMLDMMLALTSVRIEKRIDPSLVRKTDNPVLAGDNTKLRDHTGWVPEIALKKTLNDMLNYWRDRLKNER